MNPVTDAKRVGLASYRWSNNRKSIFLIALFPLITLFLFWVQIYLYQFFFYADDYSSYLLTKRTNDIYFSWIWLAVLTLAAWLWFSWYNHAAIIRGLCLGQPVTAREEPHLYAILESVCISQGISTPNLMIIENHARNSFVCAIEDDAYCLFITRGLLEALAKDEVEAVIAHEIAHIIHDDTRLISMSIAFSDLYPLLTNSSEHIFNNLAPNDTRGTLNPIFFIHPVAFIFLLPLWGGYVFTSLVRTILFIHRELDADATAYEITKDADALMRALLRIHRRTLMPHTSRDVKFLCIGNAKGGFFATHPRLSKRLSILSAISGTPVPEIEESSQAPVHKRFQENPLLKRVFSTPTKRSPPTGFQ